MTIRTRFSPSPTGNLHIGSIRTALYSWLFAKRFNGTFILRIEDTDLKRSTMNSTQSIIHGLQWLGLNWDEGPYFQSKRLNRYQQIIDFMLNNDIAYKCYCSIDRLTYLRKIQLNQGLKPRYDGYCRNLKKKYIPDIPYVVRFCNPITGKISFNDQIRGNITYNNEELDDLIIQRSNGIPTYNFAVVIDDSDMNITHVIRGEDHISNTPRQINILKALGKKVPTYAHVSMILNTNREKLSKRDIKVNDILEFKSLGYLPEAIINYLVRLGWSHGNQEIFSIDELKQLFSLDKINKSSSIFNIKKLLWLNNYYINKLSKNYISNLLSDYFNKEHLNVKLGLNIIDLINIMGPRCNTLKEIVDESKYFYIEDIDYDFSQIKPYLFNNSIFILKVIQKKFESTINWNIKNLLEVIKSCVTELQVPFHQVGVLIRFAITGKISTPGINFVLYYLGKNKSLLRIRTFLSKISDYSI